MKKENKDKILVDIYDLDREYVHNWFELSYAEYLAIPRTILQSMPNKWQKKFVELMDELDDTFEWRRSGCWVKFKDRKGRYMEDNLCDYERGRRILTQNEVAELNKQHEDKFSQSNLKEKGE